MAFSLINKLSGLVTITDDSDLELKTLENELETLDSESKELEGVSNCV